MPTIEQINEIAGRHGLSADWYDAAGVKYLSVTKAAWSKWVDTSIGFSPRTGEWLTSMVRIEAWKDLNRTRAIAAHARPYWRELKPFLQEVLALFGVQI